MKKIQRYNVFDSGVFRTPIFSYNNYLKKDELFETLTIFKNKIFLEAIFLASPALYKEIPKFLSGEMKEENILKFKISILKYFIRMSTRCTPFGLFAGCGIFKIGTANNINLRNKEKYKSHTRLDMNYLYSFIDNIEKINDVNKQIKYFQNNSIYKSGNNYRYTEFKFENNQRKYKLAEIRSDFYLESILNHAQNGILTHNIVDFLNNENIILEEAIEYVNDLIKEKILVSELEPSVTGGEFLQELITNLKHIEGIEKIKESLIEIELLLHKIDKEPIGRDINVYENIIHKTKIFNQDFSDKTIFQSDLFINTKNNEISEELTNDIMEGILVLNKLSPFIENQNLIKFKENFINRYENEEIPLTEVLDVETGIGFANFDISKNDSNPLLNNIVFQGKNNGTNNSSFIFSPIDSFLLEKYNNFLLENNSTEIEITDNEIKNFKENWDDLPDTFNALIEILDIDTKTNKPLIALSNAGNASAVNLMARFCYLDKDIYTLVKGIVTKECEINEDKIMAEIVHLPDLRSGNVIRRPILREYEIPYLAKAQLDKNHIIPISDLIISVRKEKIILKSKKLNKEIIPRLSNAHNYWSYALPIYQFLGTMQHQSIRGTIGFRWGSFLINKPFLPRVRYKNIILSPATWNIIPEDIKNIPRITDKLFMEKVYEFKNSKQLPDIVQLIQGDNNLLIDFNHTLSVQMLFSIVKNNSFKLQEFSFNANQSLINNDREAFTNQIILNFYKNT